MTNQYISDQRDKLQDMSDFNDLNVLNQLDNLWQYIDKLETRVATLEAQITRTAPIMTPAVATPPDARLTLFADLEPIQPSKCSSQTGWDTPECPTCHDCRSVALIEDHEPFKVVGEVVPRTHWVVYVCHTCKVVTVANFTLRYAGDGDYMKARELPREFNIPFDEFRNTPVMQRDALIRRYVPAVPPPAPKLTALALKVLQAISLGTILYAYGSGRRGDPQIYQMSVKEWGWRMKDVTKAAQFLLTRGYVTYGENDSYRITPAGYAALAEAK